MSKQIEIKMLSLTYSKDSNIYDSFLVRSQDILLV